MVNPIILSLGLTSSYRLPALKLLKWVIFEILHFATAPVPFPPEIDTFGISV